MQRRENDGMFAGNDIYYPYASDGAVNIDGLLRRLEKDGYTGFLYRWKPHTTPEKCSGLLQRRDGLFKRKKNQRINDIYGEDDRGHFRRIFYEWAGELSHFYRKILYNG